MADTISDISGWTLTEDNLSESNTAPFGNIIGAGASVMAGVGAYMQGEEMAGAYEYNASLALMKGQFEVEEISGQEEETHGGVQQSDS